MARRQHRSSPGPDRLAEQIRELVAIELERIGDERLDMVTITDVRVDGAYDTATIFYSALIAEDEGRAAEVSEAFDEHRHHLQRHVGRAITTRRTPRLRFEADRMLSEALRIEDIVSGRIDPTVTDPED